MVNRHIGGDGQALGLGLAHEFHARRRGQPTDMQPHTGHAHQFKEGEQSKGFAGHGDARQAQSTGHGTAVGHARGTQPWVSGVGPNYIVEGLGVLHAAVEHLGVCQGPQGLREAHAARLREFGHFRELFSGQAHRERTQRMHMGLRQVAGAVLEHLHQARLIQRWVGVRRADKACDPTGHRRLHFRLQRGAVFKARLAQPGREVDEPGSHHGTLGVEHPVCGEVRQRLARRQNGLDAAIGNEEVLKGVAARGRVDDPRPSDHQAREVGLSMRNRNRHGWALLRMLITAMRTAMPNVT